MALATTPGRMAAVPPTGRLHAVDWLRALAVFGVFVYHSWRPFTPEAWHVTNDPPSEVVGSVIGFVDAWGVAFFFLIAGASTFLALRWRSTGAYVRERLSRLLLPLVVAYLLLSPLQAFIEERHFGRYEGSLLDALPLFFEEIAGDLHETLLHPLVVGRSYHLWFVIFLLWFALLGLPVYRWLRGPRGRQLSTWLGDRAARRGWALVLAVPIAVAPLVVMPLWPETEDWGTFAYLFGFYVAGGVLLSDDRLAAAVRRDVMTALAFALAVDIVMIATGVPGFIEEWGDDPSYSPMYLWAFGLVVAQSWAWVLVLLGLGMRAKAFQRPLPRSIADAAMPFLIVHQPVILGVAFWVVRWDVGIETKWLAIFVASLAVSAAIATGLARVPVLSSAFGVKHRPRVS